MSLLYGVYGLNIFSLYTTLDSGSLARYVAVEGRGITTVYLAYGLFYWFVAAYTRAGSRIDLRTVPAHADDARGVGKAAPVTSCEADVSDVGRTECLTLSAFCDTI